MDMEKILGVVFSHPLQMLASLLLAGVSIQVLGARIEGTPLPKQRIILAFVVMVALAGCSTTTTITRNADGGETTTTKTSLGGASSSQCFRKVATDAAAGGVLGYLLDRKTGAQIGAGLGSLFGLAECGDDTPRAATGHQRQLPSCQAEWKDKAACQSAGGQPVDTGVMKPNGTPVWNCPLACSDTGHQVAGATRPTFGKLYNVRAHPGWQNYLWCVGPEGVVVKADPRVGEYLYPCSPETTRNFWKR